MLVLSMSIAAARQRRFRHLQGSAEPVKHRSPCGKNVFDVWSRQPPSARSYRGPARFSSSRKGLGVSVLGTPPLGKVLPNNACVGLTTTSLTRAPHEELMDELLKTYNEKFSKSFIESQSQEAITESSSSVAVQTHLMSYFKVCAHYNLDPDGGNVTSKRIMRMVVAGELRKVKCTAKEKKVMKEAGSLRNGGDGRGPREGPRGMLSEGALGAMNMPPAGGAAVRGGAAQVRDAGPQQHEVLGHHRALHVQDGGEAVGHGPC